MGFRLEFTPTDCQFIAQNKASCPQQEFYLKTPASYGSPVHLCRFGTDVQTYKNASLAKTCILPLLLYNAIQIYEVPTIRIILSFVEKLTDSRYSNRQYGFVSGLLMLPFCCNYSKPSVKLFSLRYVYFFKGI